MMKGITIFGLAIATAATFSMLSCKPKQEYISPEGYDFKHPDKYNMPDDLTEISGITFDKGNSDLLYTEEDENGRVYYMKLGDKKAKYTTFKETGDFEDIAISGHQIVMLQSKGRLYTFPLKEVNQEKIENVQKFENILPKGEFEGLYADPESDKIYVLCKHCDIDKTSKQTSGFIFQVSTDGHISPADQFKIDVKHIADQINTDKVNFHPSALTFNSRSNEWYVLSSVNKLLVVLNDKWKVRQVFHLDPAIFPQPEGIAFDNQNNLYISNEGDKIEPGNVLKFPYRAK